MARRNNTDRSGNKFSDLKKMQVWLKATSVPEYDPLIIRKDSCEAWIEWSKYGITDKNGRGWEIDHIKPVAKGGSDDLSNLQVLQWQNNRKKGDDYPASNYCEASAK